MKFLLLPKKNVFEIVRKANVGTLFGIRFLEPCAVFKVKMDAKKGKRGKIFFLPLLPLLAFSFSLLLYERARNSTAQRVRLNARLLPTIHG